MAVVELLTAKQMQATERAAMDSGKVSGLQLMERAGAGVVEMVFETWPELTSKPHSAVVLCGPGNNGGDGYVVARVLDDLEWRVSVCAFGDPAKLPPDAYENHTRWIRRGDVRALSETGWEPPAGGVDLIVDAIFGTGLVRPLDDDLVGMLKAIRTWTRSDGTSAAIVSVDMPTGICSDSGRELGGSCASDLTVSFHAAKLGHFLGDGPFRCGAVRVVDIGLDEIAGCEPVKIVQPPSFLGRKGSPAAHKYRYGHLLVLSGGVGKGGAARLAAHGALRIGAGLVSVGCPPSALQENAAQLNAVMLQPIASAGALSALLESDSRINALCVGPGLGLGERERQLVATALESGKLTVLDADALTLIAGEDSLFDALHERCILTPHGGEFGRLFPEITTRLREDPKVGPAYSKADAAREAAERAGCTVLFKGPDTVIAAPDGRVAISTACYERSVPWLATAGSGDVLAGFVAGLLAQGFNMQDAAMAAAHIHVDCALRFGPGLIASDLPDSLPSVLRDLVGSA